MKVLKRARPFAPPPKLPKKKPIVRSLHPKIAITKGPKNQTVEHGGTATFTISVRDTSNMTLTGVVVSDPRSPNCKRTIGTLAAGAQGTSYTCSSSRRDKKDFENVAVVTGARPRPARSPLGATTTRT